MYHTLAKLSVGCLFAALAIPAYSQIEEVIVTSERRAENLQDVPVAVTALPADVIEKARVEELSDVAAFTPNFTIGQQSPTQPELTIRGIGSTDREAGSDRSVVVFVDEVYVGRASASTFDLFDLERIEVLRGPQGTLYGRNVVGGAVNLISAKPTQDISGKLQIGVGSDSLYEVKGLVSGGLSAAVSGKFSFSVKQRDGFHTWREYNEADVLVGQQNSGATESTSARGQLYFQPNEGFDALVTLEYSEDSVDGVPAQISQGETADAAYIDYLERFYKIAGDELAAFIPPPFTAETNKFGEISRDSLALYAKINFDQPYGTWTLLPAYRSNDLAELRDIVGINIVGNTGGTPKGFESSAINDESYTALSFEGRFASPGEGRFNWVVGLYYLEEEIDREQIRERQANSSSSRPLFDQLIETTSTAAFGQFTFGIIPDRLDLTLGGRFTEDTKDFDMQVVDTLTQAQKDGIAARCTDPEPADGPQCQKTTLNPASAEYTSNASESWSEFTSKIALDYRVNDDVLLYVNISEGFKSGGFVGLAANQATAEFSFDPETALNTEVGIKASLLGNRLQINANYFNVDFKDLQLRRRVLLIPNDDTSAVVTIANAAEAEISGLELEIRALPTNNLSITASLSTLDSEVVKTTDANAVFEGVALPRSPETKWFLAAEYAIPVGRGELEIAASLHFVDELFYDINERSAGNEPSYTLTNAHLTYSSDANWSVSLWGKNLTDETYRSHVQSIGGGNAALTQYGDPQTYGVSFDYRFGY